MALAPRHDASSEGEASGSLLPDVLPILEMAVERF